MTSGYGKPFAGKRDLQVLRGSIFVIGHEGSSELKCYLPCEVGETHMFDIHGRWLVVDDVGREIQLQI